MRRLLISFFLFLFSAGVSRAGELWLYCSQNLWVDKNITALETLWKRAAAAGYTHVLLSDSKLSHLADMDARYFANVEKVKKLASDLHLEIVPAIFPVGYSNDLLSADPNLIEALPVKDLAMVVTNGVASVAPSETVSLKGGDFSDLAKWDWNDPQVVADAGAALIKNPKGANARIVQKLKLKPFHQYHFSVRIKTSDFKGTPEVKLLATTNGRGLNHNHLGVKPTQDWTTHDVVFNSLNNSEVNLYLGCWGGTSGSLWFDDAKIEPVAFLNLVRRPGAPLNVQNANGKALAEGTDYRKLVDPKMGNHLWPGSYDIYHTPPQLTGLSVPDGAAISVSYYHGVTVYDDQATICVSEPASVALLRDQAIRVHQAFHAKGYMMSHDEIRVLNWCEACEKRHLDAGALLAANVHTCIGILKEVNPGGKIYVWSDMFDPNHNAVDNYYLVRGNLKGSWLGLDKEVTVLPWYFEKRRESLKWFSDLGRQQVIAGYYDSDPANVKLWLQAASGIPGVLGVMYTTWQNNFKDLEIFAANVREVNAIR
jgi:hypothetical protein